MITAPRHSWRAPTKAHAARKCRLPSPGRRVAVNPRPERAPVVDRTPPQRTVGKSTVLPSFDFLFHTFDLKPSGLLCSPSWRSVLGGFGGGMNTCFGSKLI